jgi:hypothetical protein
MVGVSRVPSATFSSESINNLTIIDCFLCVISFFSLISLLFPKCGFRICETSVKTTAAIPYQCFREMSAMTWKTEEKVCIFSYRNFRFVIVNQSQIVSVIMPPSALDQLTRLNIEYPMLFKITNRKSDRLTHAGVLEFIADEGKIYIPFWMMRNLLLEEGDLVNIENVSLPVATFSKFQPQSVDFLDITNPKAVLENCLRNFACLTTGDLVAINYNNKIYELCVLETKPGRAVTIIECDMNVSLRVNSVKALD